MKFSVHTAGVNRSCKNKRSIGTRLMPRLLPGAVKLAWRGITDREIFSQLSAREIDGFEYWPRYGGGVGCKAVIRPTAIHSAQVRVPAGTHPVELQAPDIKLRSWIFQKIGERTCSLSFRNQCAAPIFQRWRRVPPPVCRITRLFSISPHGWRSHPSVPATGNHMAQVPTP